MQTLNYRRW